MRILAIRLKNLASLAGEQVIDFTAEPLASAGLFAITGPTGAGKSTILDALCLALFGSTPRLDGVSPLNKVPDVEAEIGGGDERNLLRRGCGSGYAEVDFVGVDGHRYRARWEVKRAREKIDGRLQASSQSLTDLDSGTLLASGKKREFEGLIQLKLGLNLSQFTRAVLLAQSEFSAFLKAKDDERGQVLEKLTDTGLYSRLGQAAFEAAKEAKEGLARLEQQAGGLQPLEPEQRDELEREHQAQPVDPKRQINAERWHPFPRISEGFTGANRSQHRDEKRKQRYRQNNGQPTNNGHCRCLFAIVVRHVGSPSLQQGKFLPLVW